MLSCLDSMPSKTAFSTTLLPLSRPFLAYLNWGITRATPSAVVFLQTYGTWLTLFLRVEYKPVELRVVVVIVIVVVVLELDGGGVWCCVTVNCRRIFCMVQLYFLYIYAVTGTLQRLFFVFLETWHKLQKEQKNRPGEQKQLKTVIMVLICFV